MLQSELANCFSGLLLVAGENGNAGATRNVELLGAFITGLGVGALLDSGLDILLGELFYSWVGHGCCNTGGGDYVWKNRRKP